MLDHLITAMEALIRHYGSLGIFIASFIESAIAPIPSGLVMMSSGYALLGRMPVTGESLLYLLVHVALPLSAGFTLGSLFIYALCFAFGEKVIHRFGKYIGLTSGKLAKIHRIFSKGHRDELVLCGLRMLPLLPSPALDAVAGILKISFSRYVTATFLGTLVRAFVGSFVGWQAGRFYGRYAHMIDKVENTIIIVLLLGVLVWILWRNWKNKESAL